MSIVPGVAAPGVDINIIIYSPDTMFQCEGWLGSFVKSLQLNPSHDGQLSTGHALHAATAARAGPSPD